MILYHGSKDIIEKPIYLGKEKVKIQELPLPEVGNYDVLIQNIYSSICVRIGNFFVFEDYFRSGRKGFYKVWLQKTGRILYKL